MDKRIFFAIRLIALPVLIFLIVKIEQKQSFAGFRLLTLALVTLFLGNLGSLLRNKYRDFILCVTSIALGLCLLEAAAFVLEPKQPVVASTYGWSLPRPVIGWGPAHAGTFHSKKIDATSGAIIYDVDYTIDTHLLRQTRSCERGRAIVFFGCSFTFGEGLNDADTLPQAFADTFGGTQRVLNLAFSGYGPQQFLRELQSGIFDSAIGPQPRLFIFLTAAWHAERTACKPYWVRHGPRYVLEDGQLVLKGSCYEGFSLSVREWLQDSALFRLMIEPLWEKINRDDIDLYIKVVLDAVDLAKRKYGVDTLVPYFRSPDDYTPAAGVSDDEVMQRLREGGAVVVDLSLDKERAAGMAIDIPGDRHPTSLANRLRANMLRDYIDRQLPGISAAGLR